MDMSRKGRVTLPAEEGLEKDIARIVDKWGADAVRDSDGTKIPVNVVSMVDKVYSKYFFTRGDQEWAKANQDEMQHMYLLSDSVTARSENVANDLLHRYFDL